MDSSTHHDIDTMSSINRKPHVLKAEKSMAIPRRMVFFDTETWQNEKEDGHIHQTLRLGWACYYCRAYGRHPETLDWLYFTHAEQFWQFISEHTHDKNKLWVIARNVAFDFTVVKGWTHLKQLGYKLKFFHNKGTCNIISVRNKSKTLAFLDSMNWFVESLEKTVERIGLPKLHIDFKTCTEAELKIYCRRDVKIELENFKLFIKFLEDNSIARLCYTRGSTAMSAFLLRHYTTKIYIHNNEQAIKLERASYKGGRVECFYLGDLKNETFYMFDVNSLYPFIMRSNLFPVKYIRISHNYTVGGLRRIVRNKAVVAKVLIETDEPVYAIKRERLLFPIGRFWTVLTTPELKYAFARGHIKAVADCVVYEQAVIFKSYVDKFYTLRQEFKVSGNAEYEELCKKMLNSLYGKFGQKGEDWKKIGECPSEPDREEMVIDMVHKRISRLRYLLGQVFRMTGHGECFDSFPAIAAHVTAYARLHLWSLMQAVGWGNYFYCDTDSLIVNEKGLQCLKSQIHNTSLGGLKVAMKSSHVTIQGLKDYSIAEKKVIKGIRKNAVCVGDGVYEQEQWSSFRGLLRSGQPEDYVVKTITKHLNRDYKKGDVTVDGVVLPYVFDDCLPTL